MLGMMARLETVKQFNISFQNQKPVAEYWATYL